MFTCYNELVNENKCSDKREELNMAAADIIRSVFEFALIVITVLAVAYEQRIAAFERKLFRACLIRMRNRRSRRQKAALHIQSRASVESDDAYESAPALTLIGGMKNHQVA